MAAAAHLLPPALSKRGGAHPRVVVPRPAPALDETLDALAAEADACVFSSQGAYAEAPLTSEPPLADATPLTSETPLADELPLTSESAAGTAAGLDTMGV